MVKHIQTIRRQQPTNCLGMFDHFVELVLEGLITIVASNNSNHVLLKYAEEIEEIDRNTTVNIQT